ncbi:MAG TPA: response regulator transcription factor [Chloroflexia bacterium]|nr:response regulator transcription factor [Chloroflexia bacterium]
MNTIQVLLAEDHNLVRAGIRSLLEKITWVKVVAEADDGQEAVELVQQYQPDIVLMDITMPRLNGLEALRIIKQNPNIKVVILSMHTSKEYVWQALRLGATGYVIKDADIEELEFALKAVVQGQLYLSPPVSKHLVNDYLWRVGEPSSFEQLKPRQRQILQLIAEGRTTKQIAEELNIGVKTAETHRMQLMQQLDIHDVTGLVRYAIKMGLVSPDD